MPSSVDAEIVSDTAPAVVLHALVDDVDWPARDVPVLLHAIVDALERVPAALWDDLSSGLLPHGSASASASAAPAIRILAGLAAWRDHPSRTEAIRLLREIAVTGDAALAAATAAASEPLIAAWRDEPSEIRAALLLLLSAQSDDLLVRHVALSDDELPADHQEAFAILTSGGPTSAAEFELVCEFADWAMGDQAFGAGA